jgi:hypothetical protein
LNFLSIAPEIGIVKEIPLIYWQTRDLEKSQVSDQTLRHGKPVATASQSISPNSTSAKAAMVEDTDSWSPKDYAFT